MNTPYVDINILYIFVYGIHGIHTVIHQICILLYHSTIYTQSTIPLYINIYVCVYMYMYIIYINVYKWVYLYIDINVYKWMKDG